MEAPQPTTRWVMIWPPSLTAPLPHEEMPEHLKGLYEEARSVSGASPRSAAALLRLLLENLLQEIAGSTDTLNRVIGQLVREEKLNSRLQKTADYLRLAGNDAVHPVAEIQAEGDTSDRVGTMFRLVNLLVQELIAGPREVEELYQGLPDSKLTAIEQRDGARP